MVKTMYVPNTIGIPTHEVNLWHHGLRLVKRNPKSQWGRYKVNEEEDERKREEKGRGSGAS
jgi:hypothetical protein